jgi:hypothetical protein
MNPEADTAYISRDDETEARRLVSINGVGEEISYLDPSEVRSYAMSDYGMGLDEEETRKSFR